MFPRVSSNHRLHRSAGAAGGAQSRSTLAGAYVSAFASSRLRPRPQAAAAKPDASLGFGPITAFGWTVLWGAVLGSTGFAAGFFGPLLLQPGSNQGPLLGIFFTGPLGVVGGLILGAIFSGMRRRQPREMVLLIAACSAWYAGGICFLLAISAP